jgi:4-amino-4-deoxy-L-arabinose transferase-like glycosyltransferase
MSYSTLLTHRPARELPRPTRAIPTAAAAGEEERRSDPGWTRPALIALLALTALAYTWDLSASGYANSFYAAAVQAGTKSWKAFFFGSLDSSNFITVDKPPGSLWVMALSGRIFGFSSQSMLVPQALEGVAAVALLYASVKRWFGASAGLAAGALLAITPVAALMFRFDNPDALLVCLLVAGAYCLTRALEHAGTKWVIAAGAMIGFAFLAKMMQAFLVLPAFGLVYLVAAPTGLRRRIVQMLAGAGAIVVSCGWWVAIVALWPASSRPFIDGSPDNSILNLITGYNGLGRIFGSTGPGGGGPGGGGGGGGGGTGFSGATGPLRLFDSLMGAQASWLLPAALLALVLSLWRTRRAPRTDRTRAALLLWGGWLIVTALIFSFSTGVIHTYYTVALAPAIAALVAIGGSVLWRARETTGARLIAALAIAITAGWSYALLDRTPTWESWLGALVLATATLAVIGLLVAVPAWRRLGHGGGRGVPIAMAVCAALACIAGPAAYAAQTIATPHTGSIPSAGPGSSLGGGGFGPGGGGGAGLGRGGGGGTPGGAPGGQTTVSGALKQALETGAGRYRWVAAVSGSQTAASLELATGGEPVMAIGGFNNQGGNLSLARFESYVAHGDIHYYIVASGAGGGGGPAGGGPGGGGLGAGAGPGGGSSSSAGTISSWVKAHFKALTIGGQTLYELTP